MLWSPNCQLLYPFENQANDYSGNARHGTVFGSGVYATRPNAGRCLYFDGVGDYVATPSFGLSGTAVVFAAWVNCLYHATMIQTLISEGSRSATQGMLYAYRSNAVNHLYWQYATGTTYLIASAPNYFAAPYNGTWLHLCVVCDYGGGVTYFYRNATLHTTSGAMTTPVFPVRNNVKYIGSYAADRYLTDGYMAGVYLGTLQAMIPLPQMLVNANRLMLGMNPIW